MLLFTYGSAKSMVKMLHQQASPIWGSQIYENLVVSVANIHVPIGCIYLRSMTYSTNSILHRHEFKMMGKSIQKIAQTLIHGDLTGWKVEKTPFDTSNKKDQCGTPLKRDCLVWYGMVLPGNLTVDMLYALPGVFHDVLGKSEPFFGKSPLTSQHLPSNKIPRASNSTFHCLPMSYDVICTKTTPSTAWKKKCPNE